MQTLLEVLNKTTAFFQQKGIARARVDAEWLLADALGCKRLDLYLQFERLLDESMLKKMRSLVARRAAREPLQYILGNAPFCGLLLKVQPGVLIPRPETEELVEYLVETIQPSPARVLDLGTGTGAIALALAAAWADSGVVAVDYSSDALNVARANAEQAGLEARVSVSQSDWFSAVEGDFNLIVSNPPYLSEEEWGSAEPEVRDHEPRKALIAANDGLSDLETILLEGRKHLMPGGTIALETGARRHDALANIAEEAGYDSWETVPDLRGTPRFFLARAPDSVDTR